MTVITTKFSVGDLGYQFDANLGIIYRSVVHEVRVNSKHTDMEITYELSNTTPKKGGSLPNGPEYEQNLYTDVEVKDIANTWLVNKSVSIFSNAGL
ncbi:MAG: hypothetical protein JHC33_04980 [Ignisphaera sp.]|nr:hypothetical protein [Ignisphaera sp.]